VATRNRSITYFLVAPPTSIIHWLSRDLTAGDILRYITEIGARHPDAVHIGYGFRYDANMIVRHLPLRCLTQLRQTGRTFYNYGGDHYRIHWLPGKRFQVTRMWGKGQKQRTTVTIDDVIAFFACSFMKATESILADELTDEDREVIAHGKAERGSNCGTTCPMFNTTGEPKSGSWHD
jgi:hypothetical protein